MTESMSRGGTYVRDPGARGHGAGPLGDLILIDRDRGRTGFCADDK
jgi:hypothetical protein